MLFTDPSFLWWVAWWALTLFWVWITIVWQSNQMKKEREITYKKEEFLQLKKSYEELLKLLQEMYHLWMNILFKNISETEYYSVLKWELKIVNQRIEEINIQIYSLSWLYLNKNFDIKFYQNFYNNYHDIIISFISGSIEYPDYGDDFLNIQKKFEKLEDEILNDYKEKEKELNDLIKK